MILFEELYEASKRDNSIIVGSEIRTVIGVSRELYDALSEALNRLDGIDWSRENDAPLPAYGGAQIFARAALKRAEECARGSV